MNRGVRYFLACLAICCGISSCVFDKPAGEDLVEGDLIPDFTVTMNDGTTVSGEMLREGISCVVFFHTSCPDCQKALPIVQQIYEKYTAQGVAFAVISREEEDASVSAYWNANSLTMPYSAQSTREIYNLFAQTRVPRIYLCEKGGVIRNIYTDDPVPEYEELDSQLSSLCGNGTE